MSRHAIVLMNLGGPDRPESVRPFLFNLFKDPAIIRLPAVLRLPLAHLIAKRRAPLAREIYAHLGGGSPLLALTQAQARALEAAIGEAETKVFVTMRYWHPMSLEVASAVKEWDPADITLLPLYPQYSTTTTASSLTDWRQSAAAVGLKAPARAVCCYPTAPGLIAAQVASIREALAKCPAGRKTRVLFSAHGLPRKVIRAGDPYKVQVERTADAIVRDLRDEALDWSVCFQSRVGPLEWIGPSIDQELKRAADHKVEAVVIVPIAFVSEHSETLVELDIEYRKRAEGLGISTYVRVPALGVQPLFIDALKELVIQVRHRGGPIGSQAGTRLCPDWCGSCPLTNAGSGAALNTDPIVVGA